MSICYIGPLQRTPGRRACASISSQADAPMWRATDCLRCKGTVVGLKIETTVEQRPAEVVSVGSILAIRDEPAEDGPPSLLSWDEFDRLWQCAAA